MAVSRAMHRLLGVLRLEEEQCRRALESALSELRRWERALEATADRDRGGRRLIAASAANGDLADRLAGLEETRSATRRAAALRLWIDDAEEETGQLRQAYLEKRIARRQAEELVQQTETAKAIEAGRRTQQALDDWYLNRRHREALIKKPEERACLSMGSNDAEDEPFKVQR